MIITIIIMIIIIISIIIIIIVVIYIYIYIHIKHQIRHLLTALSLGRFQASDLDARRRPGGIARPFEFESLSTKGGSEKGDPTKNKLLSHFQAT